MQKAPLLKGSGLKPLEETKSSEEVHVFGKNLEERVVAHKDDEKPAQVSFATSQSELNNSENDIESIKKRKFDAITGEEDEETVFQGDFKLFVWDKESSNWMEKGRGQLKLNDYIEDQTTKSRLIMRISGTLRIILNVAVKSTFRVIASSKTNIRFTDSLTVWAVSGSNVQQLKNSIEERLVKLARPDSANENEQTKKPKSDPVAKERTSTISNSEESLSPTNTKEDETPKEVDSKAHGEERVGDAVDENKESEGEETKVDNEATEKVIENDDSEQHKVNKSQGEESGEEAPGDNEADGKQEEEEEEAGKESGDKTHAER